MTFEVTHSLGFSAFRKSVSVVVIDLFEFISGLHRGIEFQAHRLNIVSFHGELSVLRRGSLIYILLEFACVG